MFAASSLMEDAQAGGSASPGKPLSLAEHLMVDWKQNGLIPEIIHEGAMYHEKRRGLQHVRRKKKQRIRRMIKFQNRTDRQEANYDWRRLKRKKNFSQQGMQCRDVYSKWCVRTNSASEGSLLRSPHWLFPIFKLHGTYTSRYSSKNRLWCFA